MIAVADRLTAVGVPSSRSCRRGSRAAKGIATRETGGNDRDAGTPSGSPLRDRDHRVYARRDLADGPPRPTASRPASNCGFTSATTSPPRAVPQRRRGARGAANERDVVDDEVCRHPGSVTPTPRRCPRVRDARVVVQLPFELPFRRRRIYARGASLKQAVGEASGGRADVERDSPGHVEPELIQRGIELLAAARRRIVVLRRR